MPPAFVARFPPIWHEPSEPRLEWKQAFGRVRGLLYLRENAARLDGDRIIERLETADAVHAAQRQHDLRSARIGRGAAAVAGVAPVRNDADSMPATDAHDACDVGGTCGQSDQRRAAGKEMPEVVNERLDVRSPFEIAIGAERRFELGQCGGGN